MKKSVSFIIPRVPPSLNAMLRDHWIKRSAEQKKWDEHVWAQWMAWSKFLFLNPVKIYYVLSFNSIRPRDLDNYIGGTKYITDALKKTFFIRDDAAWVKSIEVQFIPGKEQTQIIITEVG